MPHATSTTEDGNASISAQISSNTWFQKDQRVCGTTGCLQWTKQQNSLIDSNRPQFHQESLFTTTCLVGDYRQLRRRRRGGSAARRTQESESDEDASTFNSKVHFSKCKPKVYEYEGFPWEEFAKTELLTEKDLLASLDEELREFACPSQLSSDDDMVVAQCLSADPTKLFIPGIANRRQQQQQHSTNNLDRETNNLDRETKSLTFSMTDDNGTPMRHLPLKPMVNFLENNNVANDEGNTECEFEDGYSRKNVTMLPGDRSSRHRDLCLQGRGFFSTTASSADRQDSNPFAAAFIDDGGRISRRAGGDDDEIAENIRSSSSESSEDVIASAAPAADSVDSTGFSNVVGSSSVSVESREKEVKLLLPISRSRDQFPISEQSFENDKDVLRAQTTSLRHMPISLAPLSSEGALNNEGGFVHHLNPFLQNHVHVAEPPLVVELRNPSPSQQPSDKWRLWDQKHPNTVTSGVMPCDESSECCCMEAVTPTPSVATATTAAASPFSFGASQADSPLVDSGDASYHEEAQSENGDAAPVNLRSLTCGLTVLLSGEASSSPPAEEELRHFLFEDSSPSRSSPKNVMLSPSPSFCLL